jgi:cytoskeletal protein RodZ
LQKAQPHSLSPRCLLDARNPAAAAATRRFVRTVEEEHPSWWDLFEAVQLQAAHATGADEGEAGDASASGAAAEQTEQEEDEEAAATAAADTTTITPPGSPLKVQVPAPPASPPPRRLRSPPGAAERRAAAAAAARASANDDSLSDAPLSRPLPQALALAAKTANQWTAVSSSGVKPRQRYQHAMVLKGDLLYVVGGNSWGRYYNDTQVRCSSLSRE